MLYGFCLFRSWTLNLVCWNVTPRFLLNVYQWYGQNFFPLQVILQVILFLTSELLFLHTQVLILCICLCCWCYDRTAPEASIPADTERSVDGPHIWPQSSLSALFNRTSQTLCYRPRYEWYAISRYLSLSMPLNVCLFRVAAHFTYCSSGCSNNESAA
jgi:hypothetical protein